MSLSDAACRAAKPGAKPRRLFDGGGLYLEVSPAGSKLWRWKYRFAGKEKRLALGSWPATSLAVARQRATEARGLLEAGVDPSSAKAAAKAAHAAVHEHTFEAIAREWFDKMASTWAPTHASKIIDRLARDVFPWIGSTPIADVDAPAVLAVLRRIEARSADTARRAGQNIGQVMRYAIATGRATHNPVPDLRGALTPPKKGHFPAMTEPAALGGFLRALDAFTGTAVVRTALRLLPLLFVRPGELRTARWADIDLERGEWRFTTSKTATEHLVPLAPLSVAILADLKPLTGSGELVFPGGRDPKKALSDAAMNAALRRLGFDTKTEITPHGFRATARTLLAERLGFEPQVIEHQLAHKVPDALGRAYNRTQFLDERRRMMAAWAAYLEKLKAGGDVVPIKGRKRG